jgi:hypothetical protein
MYFKFEARHDASLVFPLSQHSQMAILLQVVHRYFLLLCREGILSAYKTAFIHKLDFVIMHSLCHDETIII